MALMQLSGKDYEIVASILKDGPGMRQSFTFKDLLHTLESIGFSWKSGGQFVYGGKVVLVFKPGDKSRAAVSSARQDELKQQFLSLFGWMKGTFAEH